MLRLNGKEVYSLMEAYQQVYASQELTEEQVWEGVENWVQSLLEEGYDLSNYTWEEMYENYITENPALLAPAIGSGAAAAPYVLPALGAAAALIKNNLNKTNKMVTTPDEERFLNTGQFATKRLDPQEKIRRKDARAAERERLKKLKDSESNTNVPSPTKPPVKTDPPKVDPPKVDPRTLPQEPPAQKIDPLQTVKDIGKNIPGIGKLVRNTLGQPARERAFGTTRSGQVVRGLGTAGAAGLDVRGNLSDPTGTTKSTTAQVGSIGPGTVGNVLRSTGAFFGGDKPSGGSGLARGAYETGKDLQRLGQRMLDQPKTSPSRTQKLIPGLNMSYEPEGNILLERENIITEGPDWNSVPKPKGVAVRTLGNERKVFIPGQGWQFPATARRWARAQGYANWDKIPNPPQPPKPTKNPPVPPTTKNPPVDPPVPPTTQKPPVVPPTTQKPPVVPPTTQKPPVVPPTSVAQTGNRDTDLTTWANANKGMINKVGTQQQKDILSAVESGKPLPKAPESIRDQVKNMQKIRMQSESTAYDLVLEYLISTNQADTIAEAHYVMMQLDSENIGTIVEYMRG